MPETAKKARRGRPRTVDFSGLIRLSMGAWWQDGLYSASLNELCRRAGVSKPLVYREFGGEDGLMTAALALYRAELVEPMLGILERDQPFPDQLERLLTVLTADRGTPSGCFFTRMRLDPLRLGDQSKAALAELVEHRRGSFAAWYARGLSRGEANPALTPEQAAAFLDSQITSLLVHLGSGEPLDQARAQAALAFRVLLG